MNDLGLLPGFDAGLLNQYRALSSTQSVRKDTDNESAIHQVAQDFEAFFAGLVCDQMMSGIEPDSLTGGGEGESMFRTLLNQEFGKQMAQTGGLGIADIVQRQLMQLQEI